MIQNCENCVGETRLACDAIYAEATTRAVDALPDFIVGHDRGELAGVMEVTQMLTAAGEEDQRKLDAIGCSSSPEARALNLLATFATTLELDETVEERIKQAETERLEQDLQDARTLLAQAKIERDAEKQAILDSAVKDYCRENGWDADNLNYVQNLDVQGHLRRIGLIQR